MTQMDTKRTEDYTVAERKGNEEEWRTMACIFHFDFPTESYCPDCLKPFMFKTTLRCLLLQFIFHMVIMPLATS